MCSKNDSNACGGGGDDGGGASLRKSKRPRVPKRGPGVAELERILSEQHQNRDVQLSDNINLVLKGSTSNSASSHQCLIPTGFQHFSHNSVPFGPDQFQPHFSNGTGNVGKGGSFNGCNGNNACGGSHGSRAVRIGASGAVSPEKSLIPANWGSGDQQSGRGCPEGFAFPPQMPHGSDQSHQYPMLPKKPCQFHPSMMNLFIPPRSPASSAQFSAGMYNHLHVEPPSNQRVAHNCSSTWPKEDRASSCKRQWPFTEDSSPVAPSITCQPPRWHPGIHMLGSSSSTGNNVMLSLGTPSSTFAPSSEKSAMENGAFDTGPFCSSPVPPPWPSSCQQEFSKANPFQVQEFDGGHEESYRRLATDELIPLQRPCYTFIPPSGAEDTTIDLLNEITETRDAIDLNLKL